MNPTSLGTPMRRFAAIALVLVLAPLARGYVVDSTIIADHATGKYASAPIVLTQGRCFNGRCY